MKKSDLVVKPLDLSFGAHVHGIKLAEISDTDFSDLYQIWLQYGLLIFTDQWLTRTEQIKFAKRFGALEFEIAALSNVLEDGDKLLFAAVGSGWTWGAGVMSWEN